MSKGNNQKGRYKALNIRLAKYVALVQAVYDALNQQAANIATRVDYDGSKEFHFSDFPEVKEAVQRLQLDYVQSMRAIIYRGTSDEWKQSNLIQDLLADKVLGRYGSHAGGKKHDIYYQTNSDALKAFQQRKDNGMGLSQRLWNISGNYKEELEYSISTAIQKGTSAVQLSKKLSKYLNDFPSLKKDYKEKYGKAVDCHDCEYRSIRLARSEINMAYRSAEQMRWMQMDFVLGKEIKLSKAHKDRSEDICDILQGKYPKDFDWKGWHSNCYLPNAQVLTNHGWKHIKDVEYSDLVLSLNPTTRTLEYVGITAKQAFEYEGDIVRFTNRALDCAVTADHKIVFLGKCNGRIRYMQAKDFDKNKGGFYRGANYDAPDRDTIVINGKTFNFDLFCELMAYWLSDGSLQHNNNVTIAQMKGQPAYDGIVNCLTKLGYHIWFTKESINFNDKRLNEYLRQFGKSNKKFVPKEILHASKRQLRIFLGAYVKCDGYVRKPHAFVGNHGSVCLPTSEEAMYFTTSPQLCGDLCEILLKVGLRPSISLRPPTEHAVKKDGSVIKGNYDLYVISVCHSLTATAFAKKIEPYKGMVYDLTLERNHIMYIQQNGKCYWGSNCMCYEIPILKTEEEYWHDEDTPPINQTKPITEFPSAFNEYMGTHLEKISTSNHKGTLSYWLRDNADVKGCALLMNKAKQVGNEVQQIAERVAGEHGAKVTPINYKGFASLYRKVHYAGQDGVRTALSEIKDSVRNTVVLDGDLGSIIKDLAKDSHWLRTKIQTADKFCGYTGNIVNLTMDNGVVAEIQVNTPKMIFAKESERRARAILGNELYDKIANETGMEGGLGHKLYEQIRVLDKVADADKKAELEKQMKEYYSHFNGIGEKRIVYREFKTIKECNAYAEQFPFIGKMDYDDCPVHIANRINKRLTELYEMHMVPDDVDEKISVTTFFSKKQKNGSYLGGSYNHVGECKMNIAYNGDRIRNRIIDKERREFLKGKEEQLKASYHNLSELEKDVTERADWFSPELLQRKREVLKRFKEYMPQLLENIEQEKKNWKPKLFSCARSVEDNFTHEFGHYVEDMIQKNWDKFSDDVHDAIKKLCIKYGYDGGNRNNLIFMVEKNLFDKAAWGAESRLISDYAGTNGAEYFAEAFLTYYQKGDTGNKELNDLFKILFKK